MNEIKRLVFKIFNLLDLIENQKNQSIVRQIRGLLNEIVNLD